MNFYIYVNRKDSSLYVVLDDLKKNNLPDGDWQLYKTIPDDGQPRVPFNDKEAKSAIEKDGYYIFKAKVQKNIKNSKPINK